MAGRRVDQVRRVIEHLAGTPGIFPVSVSVAEAGALRDRVVLEKAVHTIEIGLAHGMSALHICEALLVNGNPDARHTVLDPYQASFKNAGLRALEEAGVMPMIEFHPGESQIVLPRFVGEGRQFDLAFVDGSHLFDRVFLDLIYLGRAVRPAGIVFVDDYQAPAVARAVSFCLTNLGWAREEVSALDEHHQWAVLRTPRQPVARSHPHFVEF